MIGTAWCGTGNPEEAFEQDSEQRTQELRHRESQVYSGVRGWRYKNVQLTVYSQLSKHAGLISQILCSFVQSRECVYFPKHKMRDLSKTGESWC